VDNDIARHCAFSLPAVALTLGRANWPLIKETYESLANDMQWKVTQKTIQKRKLFSVRDECDL
jgi:hypothetical protein